MDEKFPSSYQWRRDSYSDRICDNLSEILLQYLSPEDKFRLQCVSKRFQKTIFIKNKLWRIVFNVPSVNRFVKVERMVKRLDDVQIKIGGHFDDIADEIVSSHYSFVDRTFSNRGGIKMNYSAHYYNEMLGHMTDSFGSKLVSLTTSYRSIMNSQNLKDNLRELKTRSFEDMAGIEFKRLVKFEVFQFGRRYEDLDLFDKFAEKHIEITHLTFDEMAILSYHNYRKFLIIVSKFSKLVHLSHAFSFFNINFEQFKPESKLMADKCRQLKSLKICSILNHDQNQPIDLSSIIEFRNLKRLHLSIIISDKFKISIFESLGQLTHLTIGCQQFNDESLPETILTDIDFILPNLVSLKIFSSPIVASGWTGYRLSRLPKLETVVIKIKDSVIAKDIRKRLIKNCKYIRDIEL